MNGLRQGWLVARREMCERSRSRAFRAGIVVMLILVVAAIALPELLKGGRVTKQVGFTGPTPAGLPAVVVDQAKALDVTVRLHHYDDLAAGEKAVRDQKVDVLVVDAQQLKWRGKPDERLRAIVTGSIQLVAVQQRAAAAGIDPGQALALLAPVTVTNGELGLVSGRSPDNEAAAYVMSILLFVAILMYGNLVLTGVAEEKASRVVEVLLARMPARNLLAGKVTGIGLLGFAQLAATALAALVTAIAVGSVHLPAVTAGVLAWVVIWFVLGYAMYAMAYGALGSLASRAEDASTVAGPASYLLIAAYWAAYVAVASDPGSGWSKLASIFPATAPFAMPGRIALGAATWWEPLAATAVTLAAIAGLVVLAGRVYTGAILRGGATLTLRDAWRGTGRGATRSLAAREGGTWRHKPRGDVDHRPSRSWPAPTPRRWALLAVAGVATALAAAVFMLTHDVIVGVAVGAAVFAAATKINEVRLHAHR
jgi:ABC-2 type transport system permease protein